MIGGQTVPVGPGDAVEVIDDFAVSESQFADEFPGPLQPGAVPIHETVISFFQPQHAKSAEAPTDECPNSSWPITRAGFHVERRITSSNGSPMARNLDMTLSMSFMPPFMLPMCRSVEMASGRNPSRTAGTAIRQ